MYLLENIYDVVVLSSSVLSGTVKGHEEVLPSPEPLAVQCSLDEGEQGFVIC